MELGQTKLVVGELSFFLYDRALHPELFRISRSSSVAQASYQAQIWIVGLSHVVTVQAANWTLTELVTAPSSVLPERGLLASFPLRGERDHQLDFDRGRQYIISSQVERLSDNLFRATYRDLVRTGKKRGMLASFGQWATNGLSPFTYIDCDPRHGELHVQAFHVFPDDLTVLKTQSIFQAVGRGRIVTG